MGNELCTAERSDSIEHFDHQNPQSRQKVQMSTAVPHENGSSNNDVFRQDLASLKLEQHNNDQNTKEKAAKPQGSKAIMHSIAKHSPINYDKMQLIRLAERRKRINQYEVDAPLSVIMLVIQPGLRNTINQMGHDIFQKYYQQDGAPGWKLHKNGYYINYIAKKLTAIMTQDLYFQGDLIEDDTNRIFPKSSGILLTQHGRFQGAFRLGKANGDGSFEDRHKQAFYKGTWKDGKLVQGVIDTQQYKYKGNFHQNIAQGEGNLFFKQHSITYQGQFKKGKYYAKEAVYDTKNYVYKGCFINGKKNREGVLVQKERDYKNSKVKYRPPCQYEGTWINDIYFTEEALRVAKGEQQQKDENVANTQIIQELIAPMIYQQVFEEQQSLKISKVEQKVGKANFIDDYEAFKPKFIWIQSLITQQKKKRRPKTNLSEEEQEEDRGEF